MKNIVLAILMSVISAKLYGQELKMAVSSTGEIISGGPTSETAKAALETRIKVESGENIHLEKFQPTKTRFSNFGRLNNSDCEFGFEARIKFSEPCQWGVGEGDKTLTFNLLKADVPLVTPTDATAIIKAGDEYMVFGYVLFTLSTNGWTPIGLRRSTQPKPVSQFLEDGCFNNLRLISAALAQYQLFHDGKCPFDISTNAGGTLELCGRDGKGNDKNSAVHYKCHG